MYSEKRLIESAVFLRSDVLALEAENCRLREKLENLYLVASGENGVWEKVKQAGKATWDFLVRLLEKIQIFFKEAMQKFGLFIIKIYAWFKKDNDLSKKMDELEKFFKKHGFPITEPVHVKVPLIAFENDSIPKTLEELTKVINDISEDVKEITNKESVDLNYIEDFIERRKESIKQTGFTLDISSNDVLADEIKITGYKQFSRFIKRIKKAVNSSKKILDTSKPLLQSLDELTKTVKRDLVKASRKKAADGSDPKERLVAFISYEIQGKIRGTIIKLTNILNDNSKILLEGMKVIEEVYKKVKVKNFSNTTYEEIAGFSMR